MTKSWCTGVQTQRVDYSHSVCECVLTKVNSRDSVFVVDDLCLSVGVE